MIDALSPGAELFSSVWLVFKTCSLTEGGTAVFSLNGADLSRRFSSKLLACGSVFPERLICNIPSVFPFVDTLFI